MKVCWTTWVVCGFAALTLVHTEMFTAVIDMKRMLSAEYDVARLLKTYVKKQHDRLTALSRYVTSLWSRDQTDDLKCDITLFYLL